MNVKEENDKQSFPFIMKYFVRLLTAIAVSSKQTEQKFLLCYFVCRNVYLFIVHFFIYISVTVPFSQVKGWF